MNFTKALKTHVTFMLIMGFMTMVFITGLFVIYDSNVLDSPTGILKILTLGWIVMYSLFIGQAINLTIMAIKTLFSLRKKEQPKITSKELCQNAIVLGAYIVLFLVFTYLTFL